MSPPTPQGSEGTTGLQAPQPPSLDPCLPPPTPPSMPVPHPQVACARCPEPPHSGAGCPPPQVSGMGFCAEEDPSGSSDHGVTACQKPWGTQVWLAGMGEGNSPHQGGHLPTRLSGQWWQGQHVGAGLSRSVSEVSSPEAEREDMPGPGREGAGSDQASALCCALACP